MDRDEFARVPPEEWSLAEESGFLALEWRQIIGGATERKGYAPLTTATPAQHPSARRSGGGLR